MRITMRIMLMFILIHIYIHLYTYNTNNTPNSNRDVHGFTRRPSTAIQALKYKHDSELTFTPVTNDSIRRNIIRSIV